MVAYDNSPIIEEASLKTLLLDTIETMAKSKPEIIDEMIPGGRDVFEQIKKAMTDTVVEI